MGQASLDVPRGTLPMGNPPPFAGGEYRWVYSPVFSSPASNQAKLLRVLKTIDYMFSQRNDIPRTATFYGLRKIFQISRDIRVVPLHLWRIACLSSSNDLRSSKSQRSSFLSYTHSGLQIRRFYLDTSRSEQNATRLSISSVTNHTTGMENLPTLSTTLAFWTSIISETTSINNCTSSQSLQWKTGEKFKCGKLSVRFYDEKGMDVGGVTREC